MTDTVVTLTITLPAYEPGDDEAMNLTGARAEIRCDSDVDMVDVPSILLVGIEQIVTGRHREWLEADSPMGNKDMLGALASMNARVEMHAVLAAMPFTLASSIETTLPE